MSSSGRFKASGMPVKRLSPSVIACKQKTCRRASNLVLLRAQARQTEITCTTLAGEVACSFCFPVDATIADVRSKIAHELATDKWDLQLTLLSSRYLDAADEESIVRVQASFKAEPRSFIV